MIVVPPDRIASPPKTSVTSAAICALDVFHDKGGWAKLVQHPDLLAEEVVPCLFLGSMVGFALRQSAPDQGMGLAGGPPIRIVSSYPAFRVSMAQSIADAATSVPSSSARSSSTACFHGPADPFPDDVGDQGKEHQARAGSQAGVARDSVVRGALLDEGWRVATIWECALRKPELVSVSTDRLSEWLLTVGAKLELGENEASAQVSEGEYADSSL